MSRQLFKGGVHPPEWKELSSSAAITPLAAPAEIVLPLSQHIGAPSRPLVDKKDTVAVGQPVAEAGGFVSVPIHSPVSGTVKAIEDRPHPICGRGPAIVITNDGEGTPYSERRTTALDATTMSAQEIRDEIRAAGMVGMGGAAFPTHVKLSPPEDKPIDALLLNGVECEPYLTADHRLMLEHADGILQGLDIIRRALGVERVMIGIEENKPDAIETLRKATTDNPNVEVHSLPVRYPQGAEKQLIKALLNREVPSGGLPMDVGVVVQNVGTCFAVHEWFALGKPLIERVVTVTGQGINRPQNLRVAIGSSFGDLVEAAGGLQEETAKLISGGPMMGMSQASLDVPITKGTSGVLALRESDVVVDPERACVSCARCVDACPMRLVPSLAAAAAAKGDVERAKTYGLLDCIECGCCVYVCPSKRYLVQYIRYGKAEAQRQQARAREKQKAAEEKQQQEAEKQRKLAEAKANKKAKAADAAASSTENG